MMLHSPGCTKPLAFVEVSPGDTLQSGFKEMCNHVDMEGHIRTHGAILFRGWLPNPSGPTFQQATDILMERLQMTEHMFEGGTIHVSWSQEHAASLRRNHDWFASQEWAGSVVSGGLPVKLGCIWDSSNWRKYVDSHHTEMAYSADKPDFFALYCQETPKVGGGIMLSDECKVLQCMKHHPSARAVLRHFQMDNFVLHDFLPEDGPLVTDNFSAKQYFAHCQLHTRHGDVSEEDRDQFLARCWGDTPVQRGATIAQSGYELQSQFAPAVDTPRTWRWELLRLWLLVALGIGLLVFIRGPCCSLFLVRILRCPFTAEW